MSINPYSVPTGKTCSDKIARSCTGNNPEYKHWPPIAKLFKPGDSGKVDPGSAAMCKARISYMFMCNDCFDTVWAPAGDEE